MRENNENQVSSAEINLQEILLLYLRKWWIIAICVILGAAMMFTYTKVTVTPMYQSGFSVYINNSRSNYVPEYLSNSDLSASSWLVNGYRAIVKRDRVLNAAATKLNNDYSSDQLREMVSTKKVENTQIFYVYVTHSVPAEAARIANAIAQVIPTTGAEIIDGSSARIIDYAKVPESPISPGSSKAMLTGGFMGALVAILILTIQYLRDTRIHDEEELLMLFNLPVLGRIPDFEQEGVTKAYERVKRRAAKEGD